MFPRQRCHIDIIKSQWKDMTLTMNMIIVRTISFVFFNLFFSNRRLFCDNNYTPPCIDIGEAKRNSRISSARRRQHSAFGISSLECPAVFCSKTLPKDEEGPSVLPSPCSSEASRPFNCLLISNVSTIVQFSQFTEPFNPYRYFSFFFIWQMMI